MKYTRFPAKLRSNLRYRLGFSSYLKASILYVHNNRHWRRGYNKASHFGNHSTVLVEGIINPVVVI